MSLIPEEEFRRQGSVNLAPMVDFLFLILAVFATMAITRAALFDSEVSLVKVRAEKDDSSAPSYNHSYVVNVSITEDGRYKWITEVSEFLLDSPAAIQKELYKEQQAGVLPLEKEEVKVLLHIDKNARWEPIAQAIFSIREAGFQVNPVYEPLDSSP
jgi:biopolymer transport protein ExbD